MGAPAAAERAQSSTGPVLVAGIGLPWLRGVDLAVFVRRVEGPDWPGDVLVEDLSEPAHRVLDRLLEVGPSRVVLVVARSGSLDPPGTIRRSVIDLTPPSEDEVHQRLVESVTLGIVDVDHILAVARYWRALPPGTVVIEVEPGEPLGLGFSEELDVAEKVLAMVQEEVVQVGR
jgi:hypothetical protein